MLKKAAAMLFVVVALTCSVPCRSSAQAVTISSPTFEVASVRPNNSVSGQMGVSIQPGGRFTATNVTLAMLIESAYDLGHHQMRGGPDWIRTDRFDVIAKAEPDISGSLRSPGSPLLHMLRSLLAERFKLAVREEPTVRPVYELQVVGPAPASGSLRLTVQRLRKDQTAGIWTSRTERRRVR